MNESWRWSPISFAVYVLPWQVCIHSALAKTCFHSRTSRISIRRFIWRLNEHRKFVVEQEKFAGQTSHVTDVSADLSRQASSFFLHSNRSSRTISSTSCLRLRHPVTWGLSFSRSPVRTPSPLQPPLGRSSVFARVNTTFMNEKRLRSERKLAVGSVYLNDHLNFAINSFMNEKPVLATVKDQWSVWCERFGASNSPPPIPAATQIRF